MEDSVVVQVSFNCNTGVGAFFSWLVRLTPVFFRREDVYHSGGLTGASNRSGFSLHGILPVVKGHVGKSITEEIHTYSTHGDDETASERQHRLKYWGNVDVAEQVPGHNTWSIDVVTLANKVKFWQGVVQACDLCRSEREKWRPSRNVNRCLRCQKEGKDCTFKKPWAMGKKKRVDSDKVTEKPPSKKSCQAKSDKVKPTDNCKLHKHQSPSKTSLIPYIMRLHQLGATSHRDMLTSERQPFKRNKSYFDMIVDVAGKVSEECGVDEVVTRWTDLSSNKFRFWRTEPEEAKCVTLRLSDPCVCQLMNIKSLSEILPPVYQNGLGNARSVVLVNVKNVPYVSSTHTEQRSDYLFVVHGEMAVYLGNQKTNIPGEKEERDDTVVYPDFSPHKWWVRGDMEKLEAEYHVTKHVVKTNQGIPIPAGVPHSIFSVGSTVSLRLLIDNQLAHSASVPVDNGPVLMSSCDTPDDA